jgi:elongation factor G
VVGHRSSGKTSLCDLLCKVTRVTREVGLVDRGTSLLDWTAMERRRKQSLSLEAVWMPWRDAVLQVIDAPGSDVLAHERDLALAAADGAVVVIDGAQGVQVGAREALDRVRELERAAVVVVSKLDREPESLAGLVAKVGAHTGRRAVLLQLPFTDDEGQLAGVVDVLQHQVLRFDDEANFSPEPVPERLRAVVARAREQVAEAVALCDDELLETYLEELELPDAELRMGLVQALREQQIVPVLLTSVAARVGAQSLLDALVDWMPSPLQARPRATDFDGHDVDVPADGPFVAQVLAAGRDDEGQPRTLLRVWSGTPPRDGVLTVGADGRSVKLRKLYRVRGPRRASARDVVAGMVVASFDDLDVRPGDTLTTGSRVQLYAPPVPPQMMAWVVHGTDEEVVRDALRDVVRCDRGLALHADEDTGQPLLAAGSEGHLQLAIARMRAWSGLTVETKLPPVAYREMPVAAVAEVEGVHVREDSDGLVEEYGHCRITLLPDAPEGNRFDDEVDDPEDLPERWRPAISEGAQRAMEHGPTAGYPVVGARVKLTGGAYDCLQSTDDHFRLAGEKGVRSALQRAGTRLLEPWWRVRVTLPATHVGDLIGDIAAHRGRIVGMEVEGDEATVSADCPYRELRTFAGRLQRMTAGRGRFEAEPDHYEPLPDSLVSEAIAESPYKGPAETAKVRNVPQG